MSFFPELPIEKMLFATILYSVRDTPPSQARPVHMPLVGVSSLNFGRFRPPTKATFFMCGRDGAKCLLSGLCDAATKITFNQRREGGFHVLSQL